MLRIEFLPAQQGDAIWIEYGKPGAVHRILIDAGTPATATLIRQRIEALDRSDRRFDLLIVTHVDTDHIGGVLKLLTKLPAGTQFDDVWFNAWPQIRKARSSKLGPIDGEILTTALQKLKWPWNTYFGGAAVMLPRVGPPPEADITRRHETHRALSRRTPTREPARPVEAGRARRGP
jgi:glyoxylase-like metal-dependent hydrolase (beta-lactamase superfamily II)